MIEKESNHLQNQGILAKYFKKNLLASIILKTELIQSVFNFLAVLVQHWDKILLCNQVFLANSSLGKAMKKYKRETCIILFTSWLSKKKKSPVNMQQRT